jgi:hypothetical protein
MSGRWVAWRFAAVVLSADGAAVPCRAQAEKAEDN